MGIPLSQRQIQILMAIGTPLLAAWSIYSFAGMVRQGDTRFIVTQLTEAQKSLEQSPPGIERAEEFVHRLQKINTAHAPAEVKQALAGYIAATEEGVAALRAQKDLAPFDRAMAERKRTLQDAIEKYR